MAWLYCVLKNVIVSAVRLSEFVRVCVLLAFLNVARYFCVIFVGSNEFWNINFILVVSPLVKKSSPTTKFLWAAYTHALSRSRALWPPKSPRAGEWDRERERERANN